VTPTLRGTENFKVTTDNAKRKTEERVGQFSVVGCQLSIGVVGLPFSIGQG
jgi:hypothetical protein